MSASTEWRPDGAMTIEHAAALWADAREHLANSGAGLDAAMHVDLSAVQRMDTAGCQVLLACRDDARRRGAAWRLTGRGPHVAEAMRLLGCEDAFEAADGGVTDGGPTEERAR